MRSADRATGPVRRAIRGCAPASFAVTMATGIVSAALRLSGGPLPLPGLLADVLLGIAVASFALFTVASLARLVLFGGDLRADLANPATAFSAFAFVAACDVLASDLTAAGRRGIAAALTITALAAWAALIALVPGRLAIRPRSVPLRAAGGNWYLVAVATQSLAIALTDLGRGGNAGRTAALAGWIIGLILYAIVTGLILARLRIAGLARTEPTAPYWVASGAASISVLAAAGLLGSAWAPSGSGRTAMTWVATGLWVLASVLIVPLAARSTWRHLAAGEPLRYRLDLWMIIFPSGMYAVASMVLGTSAKLPVAGAIGRVAAWPAALGWAAVFAAMAAAPVLGAASRRPAARTRSRAPIVGDMNEPARQHLSVDADDDDRPGDPPCLQRRVCPACGSVADEDPPTTCPACGADMPGD